MVQKLLPFFIMVGHPLFTEQKRHTESRDRTGTVRLKKKKRENRTTMP